MGDILVVGGTGQMGSGVVAGLVARGHGVRVLTRSADKARAVPGGALGVVGDLADPASCRPAFANVDAVFLTNSLGRSEMHEGLTAVGLARAGGVGRLVYLSVQSCDEGSALVPHFASKLAVEGAVEETGIEHTILRSNNWQQCDYLFRDAIVGMGVWPQPIGEHGLSLVDLRDVQEAAVNALTEPGHANRTYVVAGPRTVNGHGASEIWSAALGRRIAYGGDDLDAWGAQMSVFLPGWLVHDLQSMYRVYQSRGLVATRAELAETEAILGRPPRSYEQFVQETASAWRR